MTKGKQLSVSGRIETRSYDAKDGTKKYVTEVVADEVHFLEWGVNKSNGNSDDGTPVNDGEDIPF